MLFNSLDFLIFFVVVVSLFFIIPHKFRWILLLIASYYFYMYWKWEYAILIFITTFIVYITGLLMHNKPIKVKRAYLSLSLISNLGILFGFKYYNLFNESIRNIFHYFNAGYDIPVSTLFLPVGISFYTFQALSYTIDVYRGDKEPEKHFGIFALYVIFFPQLVAGPIERSTKLLPQFYNKMTFNYERVTDGLKLMAWGFFQKVVIADRLGIYVNKVYDNPSGFDGLPVLIATYFFAFQVYCDFSGYTDIAIGSAQVMGYDLMANFKRPYFAKTVAELWSRWHMSLIMWFRDYLYIPLGGNRVSKWRLYFNVILVFTLSGMWHGAQWTFTTWGFLNGMLIALGRMTENIRKGVRDFIFNGIFKASPSLNLLVRRYWAVFVTFNLFALGAIFFRARSLKDGWYILTHSFNLKFDNALLGFDKTEFSIMILLIILLNIVHLIQRKGSIRQMLKSKPIWFRWALYHLLVLGIFIGIYKTSQFIYFQF